MSEFLKVLQESSAVTKVFLGVIAEKGRVSERGVVCDQLMQKEEGKPDAMVEQTPEF